MKVEQESYEPMAAGQRRLGCQGEQEMARGQSKQLGAEAEVSICPRIAQRGAAFQGFGPGNLVYFQLIWVCPNLLWEPHICMSTLRDPNKYT